MPELIVLLPARNEEKGIVEVIDRLPIGAIEELGYEVRVIVVDGNSTDSTGEVSLSKGAELINQSGEPGKGNGVREALDLIFSSRRDLSHDLLIMLDADATYRPEYIPEFISLLGEYEVVWGSRLRGRIEKNAMSATNRFGNWFLSLVASILFFKRTTDLCTGYWGFRLSSLKKLELSADGFNLEADLFGSVSKSKMSTKEIPVDYDHRQGDSNLVWYKDGPRILLMTMKKRVF